MNPDILQQILEAGCQAPSADNSQPWKFRIHGDVVDIFKKLDALADNVTEDKNVEQC